MSDTQGCGNIKQEQLKCDVCRTINLAKHLKRSKPDMQIYEKCTPSEKHCPASPRSGATWIVDNDKVVMCSCDPNGSHLDHVGETTDHPLNPTCIKVCSKEEYKLRKSGQTVALPSIPHYVHGKLMYAIKAGIIVGSIYFTYTQGVWGDQRDVIECVRRWQEYLRSINTRRPPVFDQCGNVIKKDTVENMMGPVYDMYKSAVTTCFAGVVKVPLLIKCAYFDYLAALEKKKDELEKERKIIK